MEHIQRAVSGESARTNTTMSIYTSGNVSISTAQLNKTQTLVNSLFLSSVQKSRSLHLALSAFSLTLALLMVIRIIFDAWRVWKMEVTLRRRRRDFIRNVHPADQFPLVLGMTIAIANSVFIAVQCMSLNSVFVSGCRGTVQVVFPAVFLLAYTHFVFGLENTIRAFRTDRFGPRGKWNIPICVVAISVMLLFTWIPTVVWPRKDKCFGDLIWFTMPFDTPAIAIVSVSIFSMLLLATLLGVRLLKTVNIDPNERIASSRMVFYMIMTVVVYTLILPFHIQGFLMNFDDDFTTMRLADIALTSSGVWIAFFHLFLRVNAQRMVIKPIGTPWEKRRKIRLFGPSDLEMNISAPMAKRMTNQDDLNYYAPEKQRIELPAATIQSPRDKAPLLRGDFGSPLSAQTSEPANWPIPADMSEGPGTPTAAQSSPHKRTKSTYSLFPTKADEAPQLPATVFSPTKADKGKQKASFKSVWSTPSNGDTRSVTNVSDGMPWLQPPPALFSARQHRRDSSQGSTATVQIGLRLSVAPAAIAAGDNAAMKRILTPPPRVEELLRKNTESSEDSLNLPIQQPSSNATPSPEGADSPPKPATSTVTPASSSTYDNYIPRQGRNKVLPPTPTFTRQMSGLRMNPITTSPTSPPKASPGSPSGGRVGLPPRPKPTPGWI